MFSVTVPVSHGAAAVTRSCFDIGTAFGTLLGGFLNDLAGRLSPSHGRVLVAQFSVGVGIPLFLLLFYALPAAAAAAVMLLAGLLISWCQGVNNVIMAEVTLPRLRPTTPTRASVLPSPSKSPKTAE